MSGSEVAVRALACAAACATLLALAALAPVGGPGPQGERAAAADCTWHRHTKRVVKHVFRHGRLHRLVLRRHWWTCDEVPRPDAGAALPAPQPAAPSQPEPEPNVVGVTAEDEKPSHFGYTLSRSNTHSGRVRVELNNQGEDPHNLNLQRQGSESEPVYQLANALPGQQQVASFELPPGTYRLWCSLLEHDNEGMHATLVVE
jgi:plastocyanin